MAEEVDAFAILRNHGEVIVHKLIRGVDGYREYILRFTIEKKVHIVVAGFQWRTDSFIVNRKIHLISGGQWQFQLQLAVAKVKTEKQLQL